MSNSSRTAEALLLTSMGFTETSIQQALARANSSGRLLHLDAVIEILVNQASHTQPNRAAPSAPVLRPMNHAEPAMTSVARQTHSASATRNRAPAAGGHRAGAAVHDPLSGQTEIKTGALWKQRHVWGFAIQSLEQVELHVVIHEGRAKLRYFDLGGSILRRTLLLEGCRIERDAHSLRGFAASCSLRVHLAAPSPFASLTLFCDNDAAASVWHQAMLDAMSLARAAQPVQPCDSLRAPLIPTAPAVALAQCSICLDDIMSEAEAVCCPARAHFVHKGRCFESCVESQIADARHDPAQFQSRGNTICCPVGHHHCGAWCDADIKQLCKRDTWQVSASST